MEIYRGPGHSNSRFLLPILRFSGSIEPATLLVAARLSGGAAAVSGQRSGGAATQCGFLEQFPAFFDYSRKKAVPRVRSS